MGVYVNFYACLGVYVTTQKLLNDAPPEFREEPSCKHSAEDRAGKFCAKCGTKVEVNRYEVMSDEESDLTEYLQSHSATTVQDPETTMDVGYLIGDLRSLNPHSSGNRGIIMVIPEEVDAVVNRINKILEEAPNPINFRVTAEDIAVHYYMDQR